MFFKIGAFKNFTVKHLCWSLFLILLQGWRPATSSKRTPPHVFSCEICEIFENAFFLQSTSGGYFCQSLFPLKDFIGDITALIWYPSKNSFSFFLSYIFRFSNASNKFELNQVYLTTVARLPNSSDTSAPRLNVSYISVFVAYLTIATVLTGTVLSALNYETVLTGVESAKCWLEVNTV